MPNDQDRLRNVRFDTQSLGPEERKAGYLKAINQTLDTQFLTPDFHCGFNSFFLGQIHLVWCWATPRRSERSTALINSDRHDGISFQYVVAGRAAGEAAGKPLISLPGTVMVLDYKQPFFVRDEEERTVINIVFPRALVRRAAANPAQLHGRCYEGAASEIFGSFLETAYARLAGMSVYDGEVIGRTLTELAALVVGGEEVSVAVPNSRQNRMLQRAHQLIDERLGSASLSPELLADKLSLSRSDLYAIFQDQGGVAKAIWRRRLERAQQALQDRSDGRRISEIAYAFGFSSEAHFARAFKTAFGVTASETRRLSQGGTSENN